MAARYTDIEWTAINKDFENKGVKLISEFTFTNENHRFVCIDQNCGLEFNANFCNVRSNKSGCVPCRKRARGKDKNSTSSEVVESRAKELLDRNIVMLGEYINSATRYEWKCLKCDHHWMSSYTNIYSSKKGCARCSGKAVNDQDIQDRLELLKSRNIEMLDGYLNTNNKNSFRCLSGNCGHEWKTNLVRVWQGSGCAKCYGHIVDDSEKQDRVQSLIDRNIGMLKPLTKTGSNHKYDFKCLKTNCGFIWNTTFISVFNRGSGCPRCHGFHKTKDESESTRIHRSIRKRLSSMYSKGQIKVPIHNDKPMMTILLEHCKNQYHMLPPKPVKLGVKYELDHIIPVSLANPLDINQLCLVWDVRNLQWLTKEDNISKFNKIMPQYFTDWHYETCKILGIEVSV